MSNKSTPRDVPPYPSTPPPSSSPPSPLLPPPAAHPTAPTVTPGQDLNNYTALTLEEDGIAKTDTDLDTATDTAIDTVTDTATDAAPITASITTTISCFICMDDAIPLPSSHQISTCSHSFCKDCLRSYICIKIKSNEVGPNQLRCPDPYCPTPTLTLPDIEPLLYDHLKVIYLQKLSVYNISVDPNKAWCRHCTSTPNSSSGVVSIRPNFPLPLLLSTRCSNTENCNGRSCRRCGLTPHPFRTCASARNNSIREFINTADVKTCPSCKVLIEKDGGCSHMTCSECRHQFCWQCRSTWKSGCKNRLCPVSKWLDEHLGAASPYLKPPIYLLGGPIVLTVGVTGGAAALAVGATGAVVTAPFFAAKIAIKYCKVRSERRRLLALQRSFASRANITQGVGITFVGASEMFEAHVERMEGRVVLPKGSEVLKQSTTLCTAGPLEGETVDGRTRVIYADQFALNVCFRSVDSWKRPTVAAFSGDEVRDVNDSRPSIEGGRYRDYRAALPYETLPSGEMKRQFVYVMGGGAFDEPERLKGRTINAYNNRGVSAKGVRVRPRTQFSDSSNSADLLLEQAFDTPPGLIAVEFASELSAMCPDFDDVFTRAADPWSSCGQGCRGWRGSLVLQWSKFLDDLAVFNLIQIHIRWALTHQQEREAISREAYEEVVAASERFVERQESGAAIRQVELNALAKARDEVAALRATLLADREQAKRVVVEKKRARDTLVAVGHRIAIFNGEWWRNPDGPSRGWVLDCLRKYHLACKIQNMARRRTRLRKEEARVTCNARIV